MLVCGLVKLVGTFISYLRVIKCSVVRPLKHLDTIGELVNIGARRLSTKMTVADWYFRRCVIPRN